MSRCILSIILLTLVLPLTYTDCVNVRWNVPGRVLPGQNIIVKVHIVNNCKLILRIKGFEARLTRAKLFNIINLPLNLQMMKISYTKERVIKPRKRVSLSSKVTIPWYTPPGIYELNVILHSNRGDIEREVKIEVPLSTEVRLAFTLFMLVVLGIFMLSIPYGREMRIKVIKKKRE